MQLNISSILNNEMNYTTHLVPSGHAEALSWMLIVGSTAKIFWHHYTNWLVFRTYNAVKLTVTIMNNVLLSQWLEPNGSSGRTI